MLRCDCCTCNDCCDCCYHTKSELRRRPSTLPTLDEIDSHRTYVNNDAESPIELDDSWIKRRDSKGIEYYEHPDGKIYYIDVPKSDQERKSGPYQYTRFQYKDDKADIGVDNEAMEANPSGAGYSLAAAPLGASGYSLAGASPGAPGYSLAGATSGTTAPVDYSLASDLQEDYMTMQDKPSAGPSQSSQAQTSQVHTKQTGNGASGSYALATEPRGQNMRKLEPKHMMSFNVKGSPRQGPPTVPKAQTLPANGRAENTMATKQTNGLPKRSNDPTYQNLTELSENTVKNKTYQEKTSNFNSQMKSPHHQLYVNQRQIDAMRREHTGGDIPKTSDLHHNIKENYPQGEPQGSLEPDELYGNVPNPQEPDELYENVPNAQEPDELYGNVPNPQEPDELYGNVPNVQEPDELYGNVPNPQEPDELYGNVPNLQEPHEMHGNVQIPQDTTLPGNVTDSSEMLLRTSKTSTRSNKKLSVYPPEYQPPVQSYINSTSTQRDNIESATSSDSEEIY